VPTAQYLNHCKCENIEYLTHTVSLFGVLNFG